MFDPASLVWSSRDEVTTALLSALDADHAVVIRALSLCQHVAPPSAAAALLAVARARERPYWVRGYALRAHTRLDAPLPDALLESFFAEWFFSGASSLARPDAPGVFELRDVLAAVKTPSHERVAMRWLARSSPDTRAEALVESAISYAPPAPATTAWLADEWLRREGRGCSAENNRAVLCHVFPERARAVEQHAEARARAATALRLPVPELLEAMGPRALRRAIHRAVVARSAQLVRRDVSPAAERTATQHRHALDALRGWGEGPSLAARLLRGIALDPQTRADLVRVLLAADPAMAMAIVGERLDADDNRHALRAALSAIAASGPRSDQDLPAARIATDVAAGPEARALVSRALRASGDEAVRYLAIDAMESFDDPPPTWTATLGTLVRDASPLVSVRALASLAHRGARDAEALLAQHAVAARRVEVRAAALRALGELPSAGDHLARFDHALAVDHATFGDDALDQPAAEQAALAVARLGGDAAMTVLLRRAFGPLTEAALSVIEAGLGVGARESGDDSPMTRGARRRRVADAEGWRLSRWSPFTVTRMHHFGA